MAIKCVYSETLISAQHESHSRQFGETRDGDRLPILTDNKAVIFIDRDGCYSVQTIEGETLFIGTGIDEAIGRVDYAQPGVDLEIHDGGRTYSREEYYRHIAPVVYLIAHHVCDDDTGRLSIAYERRKNGRLLDDGTATFADDGAFADWLAEQVKAEERPPVMRFDNRLPVSVQRRLAGLDINDEYQAEIKRDTWPQIREKARERMFCIAENKQKQAP